MPSVYFYLAIFDALGDIKTQWTKTKTAVLKQINKKEELTQEEKHYLRFVIKMKGSLFRHTADRHNFLPCSSLPQSHTVSAYPPGKAALYYIGVLSYKKEELTQEEKHYLRFVIKIDSCFDNILCGRKMKRVCGFLL